MKKYYKTKLATALTKAIAISAIAMVAVPAAYAEEAEEENDNLVTITGSRIKRTDVEGSLPVTTITAEFIQSSGVTSVPDLMAQLPQMQGFLTAADSVGGGGGGVQTASLRDLGSSYTLVLLNGRRLASQDSGSSIDLNSIPLSAIERVEILTDGASALYGSDAIAGVVNFIMKSDVTDTTIAIRADKPQEEGGESWNFSVSTGFGDLGADGYNVMVAYSHDDQSQLRSVDRGFASTGILPFTYQGQDLVFQRTSVNAIPANAYMAFDWNGDGLYDANGPDDLPFTGDGDEDFLPDDEHSVSRSFNPYNETNGSCAVNNGLSETTCAYDFTETLEIFPESERDNLFVAAIVDISNDMRFKANLSYSTFKITPRIAPYPTGTFTLDNSLAIVQDNVLNQLTAEELAASPRTQVRWRTRPGGNRTNLYETDTLNFVAGLEGDIDELNWDVNLTVSDSARTNTRITGYPLTEELFAAFETGTVNIFDTAANLSDDANALIKSTMYSGPWTATDTKMNALEGSFSMPIFDMDGGQSYFAAGFDYRQVEYVRTRAQAVRDEIVLFEGEGDTPAFDLSRETYGVFGEVVLPISDELEVTASARYDNIGEITTTEEFGGASEKVGDSMNDTTFKISMGYRPSEDWLIRASIGTGFKAPSMREIAEPLIPFGVTSSSYNCPFESGDPLAAFCLSDRIQYQEMRQGFEGLKPETSEQASVGFVYAPSQEFSFTLDWWQVNIEDQVARPTESQIFGDPVTYRHLFTSQLNLGTGGQELAIIRSPQNIGESNNQGFDWGMNITNEFSFGTLRTSFNGTYVIESESLVVGGEPGEFETSLGVFGPDDAVTFRNVFNMNNTLVMGDITHKLNLNYRSGYEDKYWAGGSNRIRLASDFSTSYSGGVQLTVPSYMTWDYQLAYQFDDNLRTSFGITNLLDREPPLSLRASGAGHQVGYDPRYTDVFGRTFYVTAEYTF